MPRMKIFDRCTKREQVSRWQHVLQVLEKMTPHERREHWDMRIFGEKNECGTVGCAAGHCALNPWFRRRGFAGRFTTAGHLVTMKGRELTEDVSKFFGAHGAHCIFFNSEIRPVRRVIQEVKSHIKYLQTGKMPSSHPDSNGYYSSLDW